MKDSVTIAKPRFAPKAHALAKRPDPASAAHKCASLPAFEFLINYPVKTSRLPQGNLDVFSGE
jgi:hypothetical protein